MLPFQRIAQQISLYIIQNRVFVQVILDHLRHIGVDRLVVGQARPKCVRHGTIAGAVGIEKPRAAQRRIRAKDQRIAEVIIHATINYIHALQPVGGAHINDIVVRYQVAALYKINPHLPRKISMLKVSRVKDTRRQQNDIRLWTAFGRQRAQRRQQQLRIMLDGPHAITRK